MWLELSQTWIVVLNAVGIPAAHMGLSWAFTRMPAAWFAREGSLFRRWPGESARRYETWCRVKAWKSWLPDAAPWFGGPPKRSLRARDAEALRGFMAETRRGEAAHWAQVVVISSFTVWTPWPWALVILAWAVASNLPCLLVQRYNRRRLEGVLGGRDAW